MLTNVRPVDSDEGMKNEKLQMRLSEEEKATINDLRRVEKDVPGMSEMVRRCFVEFAKNADALDALRAAEPDDPSRFEMLSRLIDRARQELPKKAKK